MKAWLINFSDWLIVFTVVLGLFFGAVYCIVRLLEWLEQRFGNRAAGVITILIQILVMAVLVATIAAVQS